MPIKPENAARYPKNWKELRAAVLERAHNRCEQCGVPNRECVYRTDDGHYILAGGETYDAVTGKYVGMTRGSEMTDGRFIKIVLTIAHLVHDHLETQDITQLRAWCQRCHLAYDHEHHQRNAHETRRNRKATGDLFK